jgi:hypothetical protein
MVLPFSTLTAGSIWSTGFGPDDSLVEVLEVFDVFALLVVFDGADALLLLAVLLVVLLAVLSVEPQAERRSASDRAIKGAGDFIVYQPLLGNGKSALISNRIARVVNDLTGAEEKGKV